MLITKVGGGKDINWDYIAKDVAFLVKKEEVVLVHGASAKRDEVAKQLGAPTGYLTSPSGHKGVYTDKKALEILTMVYAGLINKQIVATLQKVGVKAVGLSGTDGKLWRGKRKINLLSVENGKTKLVKNTFTGKVEQVNAELIRLLVKGGYVPIITQPAISYEGELINTDNDRNIAVMAGALEVEKLVVLFEAPGLLRDPKDETTLIRKLNRSELDKYMKSVNGRMKKKLLGAEEAFDAGVKTIYWGDGRVKNSISSALGGRGTVIS